MARLKNTSEKYTFTEDDFLVVITKNHGGNFTSGRIKGINFINFIRSSGASQVDNKVIDGGIIF